MKLYCMTLIALLALVRPSIEAPVLGVVSRPSNYSVNLVFDNQCASKHEVEELTKQQGLDLEQTLLNAQDKFYQKLESSSINQNILENIIESLSNLTEEVQNLKQQSAIGTFDNPASSCEQLYYAPKPSGHYWIKPNNIAVRVYCDMDRVCGCDSSSKGWMKVADIDMTKQLQCPQGFKLINRSTPPYRTCGTLNPGCLSTTFTTNGVRYSRVCGRMVGYQISSPDAFTGFDINSNYVDGFSLTHGQFPRNHIWTFAAAVNQGTRYGTSLCPCSTSAASITVPSFVGNDYFCDSGIRGNGVYTWGRFYPNDPLWDGAGCASTSTCCEFNNPPWFCKELPQPTTDDIELRLCMSLATPDDEDSPFEIIEVFVN